MKTYKNDMDLLKYIGIHNNRVD